MSEQKEITKQQDQSLTLIEKLRMKRSAPALLLDCSSSMSTEIEPGQSRIMALREIVNSLPGHANLYYFNSKFGPCTRDEIPDPSGNTYLAALLTDLKLKGTKNVIVLTDGEVNDKTNTLCSALDMNIKCMYIGSGERPEFLDRLAKQSGGFATTEDLKQTRQLTEKLTLLLGDGSVSDKRQYNL